MNGALSLFDAANTPITWRKQGEGTYFFIQSRVPDCYEIRAVDGAGHFANPGEGTLYLAWYHSQSEGIKHSPRYLTPSIAKDACDHHRTHGTWPPP